MNMKSTPLLALFAGISVLMGGCATNAITSGAVVLEDDETSIAVRFTNRDREIIRHYYTHTHSKKHKKTPPGLAKRGRGLPPGLAKRDTLPKGLQERGLPGDLERRLSRLPEGYIRVIVGTDVVLMKTRSRVIIDIYRNLGMN
jgi:hypothetical protein